MCGQRIWAMLFVLAAAENGLGQEWATKMFATTSYDFGMVARNSKAEYEFALTNLYQEDIQIVSVSSTCGCTTPRITKTLLRTHEESSIVAHLNTDRFMGPRGATLTVVIARPFPAQVQLHVRCNIVADLVINPEVADFGIVTQGDEAATAVAVRCGEAKGLSILAVDSPNRNLTAEVRRSDTSRENTDYVLTVRLSPQAPAGYFKDLVFLVANDASRSRFPIRVEARVVPQIAVNPSVLSLGPVMPGARIVRQLVVSGKKPFRITSALVDDKRFRLELSNEQSAKTLHLLPVIFSASGTSERVNQVVRIQTDLDDRALTVPVSAVLHKR